MVVDASTQEASHIDHLLQLGEHSAKWREERVGYVHSTLYHSTGPPKALWTWRDGKRLRTNPTENLTEAGGGACADAGESQSLFPGWHCSGLPLPIQAPPVNPPNSKPLLEVRAARLKS